MVDPEKCIHCGNCIRECRHNAREFQDDTLKFLDDLGKEQISVLLAPSFFLLYPDTCGRIINFLLENGVTAAYDASFGTDISIWGYLKYLDEHPEGGYIMNTCPSFVNFVTRYSKEMTNRLLPVQSPAVCAAIYLHKYKKNTDSIAFIGPCIAKKDDFDSPETNGEISYNITFAHLVQALEGIDLSSYSDTFEGRNNTLGSLAPIEGGLKRSISHFIPENYVSLRHGKQIITIHNKTIK